MNNLNSFLSLGYFLEYNNDIIKIDISSLASLKEELKDESEENLIKRLRELWFKVFQDLFIEGKMNVIPISGGIDSRAILATMLEITESKNIHTYTFGTPKTYDFELGNFVAKKIGTKHNSFSFDDYQFSTEKEIKVSKQIDHQTFLFHHPPLELMESLYSDSNLWSGYILDWLAGSYLPDSPELTIKEAKKKIYDRGLFIRSIDLNIDFSDLEELINANNFIDRNILSYEEQIQIQNHLIKYTAPHILYKDFNYSIPAMHKELYLFLLALPHKFRKGQSLYRTFLFKEYPEVFKLPLKNLHGLSIDDNRFHMNYRRLKNKIIQKINNAYPLFVHPHTNYMDFNEGIRKRNDLNTVIRENIIDLKERKLIDWIDFDKIYNRHMSRKANHADVLIVLASLEIHLKAGKTI